jgi:hypothetical protein
MPTVQPIDMRDEAFFLVQIRSAFGSLTVKQNKPRLNYMLRPLAGLTQVWLAGTARLLPVALLCTM